MSEELMPDLGQFVGWVWNLKAERDQLRAELAALKAQPVGQEPAAEVSEETFSPDGTSDIITRKLPIGTKLYTAPQPAPAQDVVELLREAKRQLGNFCALKHTGIANRKELIGKIAAALAAHEKQSGGDE